eukprot:6350202-Lingulodinium_polyedra.AAC.1
MAAQTPGLIHPITRVAPLSQQRLSLLPPILLGPGAWGKLGRPEAAADDGDVEPAEHGCRLTPEQPQQPGRKLDRGLPRPAS